MTPIQDTYLYQEIHQQPDVIRRLVNTPPAGIAALAEEVKSRGIRHIFLAARGTSDNAGRYAKYLLGAHNRMVVSLAAPSLFTIYKQPPDLSDSLVLGISQSGKSPDIVTVLKEGQRQGALTAAITNIPDSDLGRAAEIVIGLEAGKETSLAATKTYTAQLLIIALLSAALDPAPQYTDDLQAFPEKIKSIFQEEESVRALAEKHRAMNHCIMIGRGFNYASAFEFAIKMKELTYTVALPYSSADFLHGPIALINEGYPLFIFAPSGKLIKEMEDLVEKVRERQGKVILISDLHEVLATGDEQILLPGDIPEWLSPISAIIPAQMFAMYLAHARGYDVDSPRGLHKVTETW